MYEIKKDIKKRNKGEQIKSKGKLLITASHSNTSGFTLIELMIVVAIMAFIAVTGIASYISFNNSQIFNNAYLDTKTALQRAQSLASSQYIPSSPLCNNQPLQGYRVQICSQTTSCAANCATNNQFYTISAICNGQAVLINNAPYQLPGATHFTSAVCPVFLPLNGGATSATITIQNGAAVPTKAISVNSTGVIQ